MTVPLPVILTTTEEVLVLVETEVLVSVLVAGVSPHEANKQIEAKAKNKLVFFMKDLLIFFLNQESEDFLLSLPRLYKIGKKRCSYFS